ncbi:MAG: hypothetical protein HC821_05990 [Lewinella sp.]|nr:hypothetical protein [Lewinella sp.]
MPPPNTELLLHLRTACHHCYTAQSRLLADVGRVSTNSKDQTTLVFSRYNTLTNKTPFPDVGADEAAELASLSAIWANPPPR